MKTKKTKKNGTKSKSVPVLAADGKTFLNNCEQGKARRLIKGGQAVMFYLNDRYAIRLLKPKEQNPHGYN